jgi:hypothetical protein
VGTSEARNSFNHELQFSLTRTMWKDASVKGLRAASW